MIDQYSEEIDDESDCGRMCVCVCVCVREREREKEGSGRELFFYQRAIIKEAQFHIPRL